MAGITYSTRIPGPEPTLERVHQLLETYKAWDKSFAEFHDLISEQVEGNHTTIISWDRQGLKTSWDTVQYIRRHYVPISARRTDDL
jgi:hypothetical protein